jgi:hypothetical protein
MRLAWFIVAAVILSFGSPLAAQPNGKSETKQKHVEELRRDAEQGDAFAQYQLGVMYYNGSGVAQNYAEALRWYRKAAEQGNGIAQFALGYTYENGEGVPQDYAEAVRWYRKGAEQGLAIAQLSLGGMYFNGRGLPQDYGEAVRWYSAIFPSAPPLATPRLDETGPEMPGPERPCSTRALIFNIGNCFLGFNPPRLTAVFEREGRRELVARSAFVAGYAP